MNKILLYGAMLAAFPALSQTTLFQDNFESGAGNWTLNTGSGNNEWTVNASYDGMGILTDTPDQPGTFTSGANSTYMHIHVPDYCDAFGLCNAGFESSYTTNQLTTLTNPIVSTGYTTVTLSFYYLCEGLAGNSYGSVEYSTDGGTVWTSAASYSGVSTWTQETVQLAAFNNAADLRFRFRWQNNANGNDPAFSIDELKVTGVAGSFATVATGTATPASWCFNTAQSVNVPFTASGTVNAGNVYTAQLSDATGSFASPVNIGTLTSSSSGPLTITAIVPAGTAVGTGYRIRVVASNPAATGTDNGSNLAINALPSVSVLANPADGIMCPGESVSLLGNGAQAYAWTPATGLSSTNTAATTASPSATTIYTVTGTGANTCTNTSTFTVTVSTCLGVEEAGTAAFVLYPNPTSGLVTIAWNTNDNTSNTVRLMDFSGRLLEELVLQNNTFSLEAYPAGTYFVTVNGQSRVERITKK